MTAQSADFTYCNQTYTRQELDLPGVSMDRGEDVEAFIERHFDKWAEHFPVLKRQLVGGLAGGEFEIDPTSPDRYARMDAIKTELASRARGTWALVVRSGENFTESTRVHGRTWTAFAQDGAGNVFTITLDKPTRRPSPVEMRYYIVRAELRQLYEAERYRRQTANNWKALVARGWEPGKLVPGVRYRGEDYDLLNIQSIDPKSCLIEGILGRRGGQILKVGALPLSFEPL